LIEHRRSIRQEKIVERGEHSSITRDVAMELTFDVYDTVAQRERGQRIASDERPSTPALAVLDRLEQEPVAVADHARERGDRSREIAQHVAPHGHHAMLSRQLTEAIARRTDHESITRAATTTRQKGGRN